MRENEVFQKLVKLGEGGMCEVWLVKDASSTFYAMKELSSFATASMKQAFLQEIELLQTLHHQAIPTFVYADAKKGFYVMEYLHGKTLSTGLQVQEQILFDWALQLLDVLLYLKEKGWLYCDLKPENLMMVQASIYLIDFGSVQKIGTRTSCVYGTPGFIAPSFQMDGLVKEHVLCYAFGKTLLALSGRYAKVEAIQSRRDTTLSRAFYRILMNGIQKNDQNLLKLRQQIYRLQKYMKFLNVLKIALLYLFAFALGSYLLGCIVIYL